MIADIRTASSTPLSPEFNQIWDGSDASQLELDIDRGRLLTAVRESASDKDWRFWRENRDLSKKQADLLIQAAAGADRLQERPSYEESLLPRFYKSSLSELAEVPEDEILDLAIEEAVTGRRITRPLVKRLALRHQCATSALLPEDIREQVRVGIIPAKNVAGLVQQWDDLPFSLANSFARELRKEPTLATVKGLAKDAKDATSFLEKAPQIAAIANTELDLEEVLSETLGVGAAGPLKGLAADIVSLQEAVVRVWTLWKKVNRGADSLFVESSASMPNLRKFLDAISPLTGDMLAVPLPDGGEVRLGIGQAVPAAPATPADSESLEAIAEHIDQAIANCPELPRFVPDAWVMVAKGQYKGKLGKILEVLEDEVTVRIAGEGTEPTLAIANLSIHQPPKEGISATTIKERIARAFRGFQQGILEVPARLHAEVEGLGKTCDRLLSEKAELMQQLRSGEGSEELQSELRQVKGELANLKAEASIGESKEEMRAKWRSEKETILSRWRNARDNMELLGGTVTDCIEFVPSDREVAIATAVEQKNRRGIVTVRQGDKASVLWFDGNPRFEESEEEIISLTPIEPISFWTEATEAVEAIEEVSDRLGIDRPSSEIEEPGGFFRELQEWLEQFRPNNWAGWQTA